MEPAARARRALLWAALGAVLIAVAVTAMFAERWAAEGRRETPPRLSRVPDFEARERGGAGVGLVDLAGAPWIADFIFTRCAMSCPRMTAAMKGLESRLPESSPVRLVSITVDPVYDTPEVLSEYAESHGIRSERWWFLTGDVDEIRSLVTGGFRLGLDDSMEAGATNAGEPILHSDRFVLVDGQGMIRGYYDPFEPGAIDSLLGDLTAVSGR